MRQPIDLVGGFYTDESLPWSAQDTVNYLPVAAEASGTRTPTKLVDAPGLRPFVAIGNTDGDPTAGAPIRGLHDVEGRLFVVSGRMLYEISQEGVAIPRGTIPGVGRVSMAHNQRGHGHELLVVNGSGGYVYNTANDTFTIVTDPGYPGAGVADFLDGYLMQVEPFGRFLFHSDLADALEYNTLDRFEAETQPDRVVGMIVNHQEVWAFGDRTIDVFGNVGTATGTFQNKGVSISRGCIAKWSPAIIDNGVAWLGDDRVVYHARGYDPVRISTRAIEVALSECSLTDIRNAFSFVWADRGHSVFYLTVPNGQTFGYDFSTGLWHRRATWHPERDIGGRWCLSDLVRSNGRWVGGDFRDGRLYTLDWDYMLEGFDPLIRERVSPVAHVDGRRFSVDSVELLYDTGGGETEAEGFPLQPQGPQITGDAPNGSAGFPYDEYSYIVTQGDAPISKVEIVSGSLPPGLTFDNGTIEAGTPTEGGTFVITVRVTDTNGLWDEVTDTIEIANVGILLFPTAGGIQKDGVYATGDIYNFGPQTPFFPPFDVGDYVLPRSAVVSGGHWTAVLSTGPIIRAPLPPYGVNVEYEQVETAIDDEYLEGFGEVIFAYQRHGESTSVTHLVSADAGATWTTVDNPNTVNGRSIMRGVARMASGRWIGYFSRASHTRMYYSDVEVPLTDGDWTEAPSFNHVYGSETCVAAGELGYVLLTNTRIARTEDGATYTVVFSALHEIPSQYIFVTSKGTVITSGNGRAEIAVSRDKAVSFTLKSTPGMVCHRVFEVDGRLYFSGYRETNTSGPIVYISDDDGETLEPITAPWTVNSQNNSADLVPYLLGGGDD